MAAAVGRLPSHGPLHSPTLKRLQAVVMALSIPSAVPAWFLQLLSLVTRMAKLGRSSPEITQPAVRIGRGFEWGRLEKGESISLGRPPPPCRRTSRHCPPRS